jgi:cytoskeletal protein CcmA (bactofilin family)
MAIFNSGNKTQEEAKKPAQPEAKISLIAAGVVLEGLIYTDGDIRVEGKIIGTLVCKAKLVLGASGVIEGNVDALNAAIAGTVKGNLIIRDMGQMQETGKVEGDLVAAKMSMQMGSIIAGTMKTGVQATDYIKALPAQDKLLQEARARLSGTAPKITPTSTPPVVN